MTDRQLAPSRRVAALFLLAPLAVAGCDKFDHFGRPPTMSTVGAIRAPIDPSLPPGPEVHPRHKVGPRPAPRSAGPAPVSDSAAASLATIERPSAASLWSSQPTSLFGDRRARGVGDILTVLIEINDEAELNNNTTRSRSGADEVSGANTFFGLERIIDMILPRDAELSNGVSASGTSSSTGDGSIARDEDISLRIAATVVRVLPNTGHFVISGSQEVRVNSELRDLQIVGVIRPQDITRQNTITYDKIANARISYGGRGVVTSVQHPRWGQEVIELISPF